MKKQPLLLLTVFILVLEFGNSQSQVNNIANYPSQRGVQFTFKTQGPIRGTPMISGQHIYFGSGDGNIYSINKSTGNLNWKFQTGGPVFSIPAIANNIVFASSRDGFIYAIQSKTGRETWKFKLGKDIGEQNFWDYYLSSPIVENGVLYIGAGDGFLYAIEPNKGKLIWKYNANSRIRRAPAVADGKIVFGTMSGHVIALNKEGSELWKFATDGVAKNFQDQGLDNTSIFCTPVIKDGLVAVGGRDFVLYTIDLNTGKEVWRHDHKNSWVLSTDIHDGMVMGASGAAAFVHADDQKTGKQLWQFKTKSAVYSSFTFADGIMYFNDLTGNIYGLDSKTGLQKWLFPMGKPSFSTPIVSDGIVYGCSDEGILYAVRGLSSENNSFVNAKKVVYWEGKISDQAFSFFQFNLDLWVRDYLVRQGYELVDAERLKGFMSSKLSDASRTVVVFADNKIPKNVTEDDSENTLLRKYLNAGGKVVLLSTINPLFVTSDSVTGAITGQDNTPLASKVFGINFPSQDFGTGHHYAPYTSEGRRIGLLGYMTGFWPVDPGQVTTVLATDEYGKAAAWLKNYGGPEGSGLLQLSINPTGLTLGPDFLPMRRAIEYGITW